MVVQFNDKEYRFAHLQTLEFTSDRYSFLINSLLITSSYQKEDVSYCERSARE